MSSRFKLDENLPREAVALFTAAGHDVDTVLDEQLGGQPDREVIEAARAERRIFVTLDVDFADIREYPPAEFPGIWVLRSRSQAAGNVLTLLRGAVAVLHSESPANRLWIIEPRRVRVHE